MDGGDTTAWRDGEHGTQEGRYTSMNQDSDRSAYLPKLSPRLELSSAGYIGDLLREVATAFPSTIAMDFYGREITYARFHEMASKIASALRARGVRPGTNVGLHLMNSIHYFVAFFSITMAGGTVVNCSPLLGARELDFQIRNARVRFIFTSALPSVLSNLFSLEPNLFSAVFVCHFNDFGDLPDSPELSKPPAFDAGGHRVVPFCELMLAEPEPIVCSLPDPARAIALIQYTGGTTGTPKGAMLSHANLWNAVETTNHFAVHYIKQATERRLFVLPLFHIFGTSIGLASIARATTMVIHLRFDARQALSAIEKKSITSMAAVPTMYAALADAAKVSSADLRSLLRPYTGGAPMSREARSQFSTLCGVEPFEGYGLTETSGTVTSQILARELATGSVGLAMPNVTLEVTDLETGAPLARGLQGEICIRGPQVMVGYWNDPEATEQALRGGRLHTGDIGFLDERGFLYLVDRKKDIIFCGGFNVFPHNVEKAIEEHPAVAEAAVIGAADSARGSSIKAFIVIKTNQPMPSLRDLRKFLASRLAGYEIPTLIEFRKDLPRTPIGKLSKVDLR